MRADSKAPSARVRAGGTVLSLIADPLAIPVLSAHRDRPLRLPDLRERLDGVAQTTLRGQIGNLRGVGALERHARKGMPYTVENELSGTGKEILEVAGVVRTWLAKAPQGGIALGSEEAKRAIRALIGGWGSTMLRGMAARPLSLTELSSVIGELSYPALERRLSAMRAVRQVEPRPEVSVGAAKPYGVTEWTRQAVGPLVAAGRCECRILPDATERLSRLDIEAAFLLAVPLVELRRARAGVCLLGVDTGGAVDEPPESRIAGVEVKVDGGAVTSCVSRFEQAPESWAVGSIEAWVNVILDGNLEQLRVGGADPRLVRDLVAGMHDSLLAS